MTGENKGWASATLKEVPFWRDDMGPEEYEIERTYYLQNFHLKQKWLVGPYKLQQ